MNAVTSALSASWNQYVPPLNRESVGKCLQNMTASLSYPSTYLKVVIVACVLFSLIPTAEASCHEVCHSSFNSCNELINFLIVQLLFGPTS